MYSYLHQCRWITRRRIRHLPFTARQCTQLLKRLLLLLSETVVDRLLLRTVVVVLCLAQGVGEILETLVTDTRIAVHHFTVRF